MIVRKVNNNGCFLVQFMVMMVSMVWGFSFQKNTPSHIFRGGGGDGGGTVFLSSDRRLNVFFRLSSTSAETTNIQTTPSNLFSTERQPPSSTSLFEKAEILELTFSPHRPLGCVMEEALPSGEYVFVSKIAEGSYSEQGGLQVGDVVLACSDLFGHELTSVQGLNALIGLVKARPDGEELIFRVARGSPVLQQHEAALVELCSNPSASTSEIELCLQQFLKEAYEIPQDAEECNPDNDNCLLDTAFELWNQEFDTYPPKIPNAMEEAKTNQVESKNGKKKPWSSRSSPSGTFVRDPVTGQMRNIDA